MIQSEVFAPDADSARRSRLFVLAHLDHVPAPTLAVVELLTSELATNAVRHAGTSFTVTVEQLDHEIRVAVTDGSSAAPTPRAPSPAEPSGRGLHILDVLADSWGTEFGDDAKTTWFSLSTSRDAERQGARAASEPLAAKLPGTNSPSQRDGRGVPRKPANTEQRGRRPSEAHSTCDAFKRSQRRPPNCLGRCSGQRAQ